MTLNITTQQGKIKVKLPPSLLLSKEDQVNIKQYFQKFFSKESWPVEQLIQQLKKEDPLLETPLGNLMAYQHIKGWNQQELSEHTDINQGYLSKILRGLRPISIENAKKLGKAFGTEYQKFL